METSPDKQSPIILTSSYEVPDNALKNVFEALLSLPPGLDGVSLNMISREIYEREFGIYPHSQDSSLRTSNEPVPLINMKGTTDHYQNHPLHDSVLELMRLNVPKRTGCSVIELLNQDTMVYSIIVDAVRRFNPEEAAIQQDIIDKLSD